MYVNNSRYQVKTPSGWRDFSGIKSSIRDDIVKLTTTSSETLTTPDHKVKLTNGDVKVVRDLTCNDELLGGTKVCSVVQSHESTTVYDLINVDEVHEYCTNGFVSKNCAFIRDFDDIWAGIYPTLSCVVGDTLVLTEGGFRRIDDICNKVESSIGKPFELNVNVYAKNGIEPTSHGYNSPPSATKKFVTKTGRILETTLDHPVWVIRGDKTSMVKACDIVVGDAFRIQYNTQIYGTSNEITLDEAYRLGGYIAEGWMPRQKKDDDCQRTSIFVSNSDSEFRQKFIDDGFKAKSYNGSKLMKCSIPTVKKYISYGIDPKWKCDTKRVPRVIWESPKEIQQAFLRGYFDGDGCATGGVSASTSSEKLASDIQTMMLNMGFLLRVRHKIANPVKAGVGTRVMPSGQVLQSVRDCYPMFVPRSQWVKFQQEIGFLIERKNQTLTREIAKHAMSSSTRLQELPSETATVIKNKITTNIENSKVWSFGKLRSQKHLRIEKLPTQHVVNKFFKNVPELCDDSWNEIIDVDNYYWDEVIEITDGFAPTYDFTVPGTHTFLQNMILGSNTGGAAILISTPNGVGGQYHKLWVDAVSGENEFHAIQLPWRVHPEHDQAWFDKETRNLPKQKVAQEFLCIAEGARVTTLDGYSLIEQIKVGQEVLTAEGNFKRVTHIQSRLAKPEEKLYKVSSMVGSGEMLITGDHRLLVSINTKLGKFFGQNEAFLSLNRINKLGLQFKKSEEQYVKSVAFPNVKVKNKQSIRLKGSKIDCDYMLGQFIGVCLSNSFFYKKSIKTAFVNAPHGCVEWFIEYAKKFDPETEVGSTLTDVTVTLRNEVLVSLVKKYVRQNVLGEKILELKNILSTNKQFIRGILTGYCLFEENIDYANNDKSFNIYNMFSLLLHQFATLLSIFQIYPKVYDSPYQTKRYHIKIVSAEGRSFDRLLTTKTEDVNIGDRQWKDGKLLTFLNVEDVTERLTSGEEITVYDIQVEGDSSFVVESIVVHNCDFIASGDTFLQPTEADYLCSMIDDPIKKEGPGHNVWIWSDPEPNKKYVISADVARGDGADFSTFHIIDYETCEVVGEFMGKIPPDNFADLILQYGTLYNTALLCPERNTFGYFTCAKLRDAGYQRLYYKNSTGNVFDYVNDDKNAVPGFETTSVSRPQILTKLEEVIRNRVLKIYSRRFYDQMQRFVWIGSKAQASSDAHDDLVMSLAIGSWLINGTAAVNEGANEITKALLKSAGINRRSASDLGGINNVSAMTPQGRMGNMYPVSISGNGNHTHNTNLIDYRWLMR